jgi:hypothetical protein
MVGLVQHKNLTTPRARRRLKPGRMAHWQDLIRGRTHLGYRRWPGDGAGHWLLRRYLARNKYHVVTLGVADATSPLPMA